MPSEYTVPPSLIAMRREVRSLRQRVLHHLSGYETAQSDLAQAERRLIQLELDLFSHEEAEQLRDTGRVAGAT